MHLTDLLPQDHHCSSQNLQSDLQLVENCDLGCRNNFYSSARTSQMEWVCASDSFQTTVEGKNVLEAKLFVENLHSFPIWHELTWCSRFFACTKWNLEGHGSSHDAWCNSRVFIIHLQYDSPSQLQTLSLPWSYRKHKGVPRSDVLMCHEATYWCATKQCIDFHTRWR